MENLSIRLFIDKEDINIAYLQNNRQRPEKRMDPINERIRYPEVLVIGPDGQSLGKMSSKEANSLAMSYNLDLYCVAPNANPPVCKILNYGKFRFEQQKQKRLAKKNQHVVETKQIQLHVNIGQHDLETKARHARGFIEDGNKVQACVVLKGREMAHPEIGEELLKKFIDILSDVASIERAPYWEGKWHNAILGPKKK